jgi:hypothetical protein
MELSRLRGGRRHSKKQRTLQILKPGCAEQNNTEIVYWGLDCNENALTILFVRVPKLKCWIRLWTRGKFDSATANSSEHFHKGIFCLGILGIVRQAQCEFESFHAFSIKTR